MRIAITGDLFAGGDLLSEYRPERPVEVEQFHAADVRLINLEGAVSDREETETLCSLHAPGCVADVLSSIGVTHACLANNHIHDKKPLGIKDAINHLAAQGIQTFGGGETLWEARQPCWITDSLCVLAYCECEQPYLNRSLPATAVQPGVNPLRLSGIEEDLDALPSGASALLLLHWGREHVVLPPEENIDMAAKLLRHEKVSLIVGMHAHRIQGYICHGKKRAFFCVGNFLFPNFHTVPPCNVAYPGGSSLHEDPVMYGYHVVRGPTYKKWRWRNRLSLLIDYDTDKEAVTIVPVFQRRDAPQVITVPRLLAWGILRYLQFLNMAFYLPRPLYRFMAGAEAFVVRVLRGLEWRLNYWRFSAAWSHEMRNRVKSARQ